MGSAGKAISVMRLKSPHKLEIIICDTSTTKSILERAAELYMNKNLRIIECFS